MSKINLSTIRYDKACAQGTLNKCRDHRSRLRDEVDYLQKDIDAYKRRLERAYRPSGHYLAARRGPEIEDLGAFKLYPRGVTHPPTWTYGDERAWSRNSDSENDTKLSYKEERIRLYTKAVEK